MSGSSFITNQERMFLDTMVRKYRDLVQRCAGVQSINVDGQTVALVDLEKKLEYWTNKFYANRGARSRISALKMGGV